MTWHSDLVEVVEANWRRGSTFTLSEIYRLAQHLSRRHPQNHHPEAKIRQTLQRMRDLGALEFIDDRGTYRRLI